MRKAGTPTNASMRVNFKSRWVESLRTVVTDIRNESSTGDMALPSGKGKNDAHALSALPLLLHLSATHPIIHESRPELHAALRSAWKSYAVLPHEVQHGSIKMDSDEVRSFRHGLQTRTSRSRDGEVHLLADNACWLRFHQTFRDLSRNLES